MTARPFRPARMAFWAFALAVAAYFLLRHLLAFTGRVPGADPGQLIMSAVVVISAYVVARAVERISSGD